jgi:hypothetical protein
LIAAKKNRIPGLAKSQIAVKLETIAYTGNAGAIIARLTSIATTNP